MSAAVVHYPEARAIPVGPGSVVYVAACSCGWTAGVRHARKKAAVPAAIAHARDLNRPQEEHHDR